LETQAKIEFESAVKNMILTTLQKAKELRPNAKWGYYGYPARVFYDYSRLPDLVGYPELQKSFNNQLDWLWQASGAIFPSVYHFYPSERSELARRRNETYVRENIQEAIRISRNYGNKPVIAYTWHLYHPSGTIPFGFISADLMRMTYEIIKNEGANGIEMWMQGFESNPEEQKVYFRDILWPIVDSMSSVSPATPTVDSTPPSVPTSLSASGITATSVVLSWQASIDVVGVAKYNIFRNGSLIGSPTTNNYSDSGLNANTSYLYTVSAVDTSGNESSQSGSVSVNTNNIIPPPLLQ
jgi:hypothetical protein